MYTGFKQCSTLYEGVEIPQKANGHCFEGLPHQLQMRSCVSLKGMLFYLTINPIWKKEKAL